MPLRRWSREVANNNDGPDVVVAVVEGNDANESVVDERAYGLRGFRIVTQRRRESMVNDVFDSTCPLVTVAATKRCDERSVVLVQLSEFHGVKWTGVSFWIRQLSSRQHGARASSGAHRDHALLPFLLQSSRLRFWPCENATQGRAGWKRRAPTR